MLRLGGENVIVVTGSLDNLCILFFTFCHGFEKEHKIQNFIKLPHLHLQNCSPNSSFQH